MYRIFKRLQTIPASSSRRAAYSKLDQPHFKQLSRMNLSTPTTQHNDAGKFHALRTVLRGSPFSFRSLSSFLVSLRRRWGMIRSIISAFRFFSSSSSCLHHLSCESAASYSNESIPPSPLPPPTCDHHSQPPCMRASTKESTCAFRVQIVEDSQRSLT